MFPVEDSFTKHFTQNFTTSCGKSPGKYGATSSFQEARTECLKDKNCSGVYEPSCDGNLWYLCPLDSAYQSYSGSCTYMKKGSVGKYVE